MVTHGNRYRFCFLLVVITTLVFSYSSSSLATTSTSNGINSIDINSKLYSGLIDDIVSTYKLDRDYVVSLFSGVEIYPEVIQLMDNQPEASLPYDKYRGRFKLDELINEGVNFYDKNANYLKEIESKFGVDKEFLVSILGIESFYGKFPHSKYKVFNTLNTLFALYPRRSSEYRKEIIEFILLCQEEGLDIYSIYGSYAGAFGHTQFIPSSFRKYAVDFDGDSKRDVWNSPKDIISSIANYFKTFRWNYKNPLVYPLTIKEINLETGLNKAYTLAFLIKEGIIDPSILKGSSLEENEDVSIIKMDYTTGNEYFIAFNNFRVITRWNRSSKFALLVTEIARTLSKRIGQIENKTTNSTLNNLSP